jgi:hypothetical protein
MLGNEGNQFEPLRAEPFASIKCIAPLHPENDQPGFVGVKQKCFRTFAGLFVEIGQNFLTQIGLGCRLALVPRKLSQLLRTIERRCYLDYGDAGKAGAHNIGTDQSGLTAR